MDVYEQDWAFKLNIYEDDEISSIYNPSKYRQGQEETLGLIELSDLLFSFFPEQIQSTKSILQSSLQICNFHSDTTILPWKIVRFDMERPPGAAPIRCPSTTYLWHQLHGVAFPRQSRFPISYGTGEYSWIKLECEGTEGQQQGILPSASLLVPINPSSIISQNHTEQAASNSNVLQRSNPFLTGSIHPLVSSLCSPTPSPSPSSNLSLSADSYFVEEAETLRFLLQQYRNPLLKTGHSLLLYGAPGTGKTYLVHQMAKELDYQLVILRASDLLDANMENPFMNILYKYLRPSSSYDDTPHKGYTKSILFFDDIDVLLMSDEISDLESQRKCRLQFAGLMEELRSQVYSTPQESTNTIYLIGCTNAITSIDISSRRLFERELCLDLPSPSRRRILLKTFLKDIKINISDEQTSRQALLDELADACHGYSISDLESLARNVVTSVQHQTWRDHQSLIERMQNLGPQADTDGLSDTDSETEGDEESILDSSDNRTHGKKAKSCANVDEASQFISVKDLWKAKEKSKPSSLRTDTMLISPSRVEVSQIGGLEKQYSQLIQSTVWIYQYKDQFERLGIEPPCGVLLYGPPGTGKTLLAKAVASASNANFLSVAISDLIKGEIGASEEAIASLFRKARSSAPCIIFLDEMQAMFGARDSSGSHGKNLISQLLLEMDGMVQSQDVVVIGATNRPDWIDSSLLRPGRFERSLYIPPPSEAARSHILTIALQRFRTDPASLTHDFIALLAKRTEHFTGADLTNLCMKGAWNAVKEPSSETIETNNSTEGSTSTSDKKEESITSKHLLDALLDYSPTITKSMIILYELFQNKYGRAELQDSALDGTGIPQKFAQTVEIPQSLSRMEQFKRDREEQRNMMRH